MKKRPSSSPLQFSVTSLPAGRQVCPRGENEAKLAFRIAVISIRMAKNLPKSPFCGMIQPVDAGCGNCPKNKWLHSLIILGRYTLASVSSSSLFST
jgi:hypothetical protein